VSFNLKNQFKAKLSLMLTSTKGKEIKQFLGLKLRENMEVKKIGLDNKNQ
jgi:hypothetical protein